MTAKELIEALQGVPPDVRVIKVDREWPHGEYDVERVVKAGWSKASILLQPDPLVVDVVILE